MLNDIQWFILVTFKSNMSKNEVRELGDPRHTLSMFCGRYIRITLLNTQVYLSQKGWSQLMHLGSACIDRHVPSFIDSKMNWWSGEIVCSKCFCTPPNTNATDFDTLWDELTSKNQSCTK